MDSVSFSFTFEATISIILSIFYAIHSYKVISYHVDLRKNENTSRKIDELPPGTGWNFMLVTVGLPLVCSLCASFHLNPIVIPSNKEFIDIMPSFLYGAAITIFVLMITIEIGYLYDSRVSEWRTYIIGALVLDLMALLSFLSVLNAPPMVALGDTSEIVINSLFFSLVSLGSLISSCGTILISKVHSLVGGDLDGG